MKVTFFICESRLVYDATLRKLNMGKRDACWIRSGHDLAEMHAFTNYTVIRVDKAQATSEVESYLNIKVNKKHCVINDLITTPQTKRWSRQSSEEEVFPLVDLFLADIGQLCRHHNMSISHEDGHGGFIVEQFSEERFNWLNAASVDIEKPKSVNIVYNRAEPSREPDGEVSE